MKFSKLMILVVSIAVMSNVTFAAKTKKSKKALTCEEQWQTDMRKPGMSLAQISVWSNEAVAQLFSFDYVNFRKQLQMAQSYFTPKAWESVQSQLQKMGTLEKVQKDKLVVAAVAVATPVVLQQGVFLERYSWKVQLPMLVMYYGKKKVEKSVIVTTLFITRSDKNIGKRGIAIADFLMASSNENTANMAATVPAAKKKK